MTTAERTQGVLRAFLGTFADKGFTAREEGDEVVIEHEGESAGRIDSAKATIANMQSFCQQHLLMNHGVSY